MKTDLPILLRMAAWWSAHGIRGRGVVSRFIGRWQPTKPPLFIQTRNGAALSVDYNNFDVYANIYNNGGCWDENVMDCCEHLLRPGDVFYDIGANTGVFGLDLAKIIPNLKVVAFEPQPSLAENIRRSAERNAFANFAVLEVMLGRDDRQADLFLTSHSIHASVVPRESKFRRLQVTMNTIDTVVTGQIAPPPDIIKIDVEGSELSAFVGAAKTLSEYQPTLIFEADENMVRMGYTISDLFSELSQAAAYSYFLIDNAGALNPAKPPLKHGNYVALSPQHVTRV